MYINFDKIPMEQLRQLVTQAREHYNSLMGELILAEGALINAKTELCIRELQERGIYPGSDVLVRFSDEPEPVKMRYVRTAGGVIFLRSYTKSGKLSSSTKTINVDYYSAITAAE